MMPVVAILCGGLATRLGEVTRQLPKSLVEVAGKPFIHHQLSLLREQGAQQVVLCTGHLGGMIQDQVGDGSHFGMAVSYSPDGPTPQGTGGALRQAMPLLSDSFFVMYGDSYLEAGLKPLVQALEYSPEMDGLMTVYRNEGRLEKSNVIFENGTLVCYDKVRNDPRMRHVDYGLSLLRKRALDGAPQGAFDLAVVLQGLSQNKKLAGYEVMERFYEMGSPRGLEETRLRLEQKQH